MVTAGCTCRVTLVPSSTCGVTSSEMPLKNGCSVSDGELLLLVPLLVVVVAALMVLVVVVLWVRFFSGWVSMHA